MLLSTLGAKDALYVLSPRRTAKAYSRKADLTSDRLPVFIPLGVIGFYRYLWYIIRLLASIAYRPIPVPAHPTYFAEEDVTVSCNHRAAKQLQAHKQPQVIVPTIDSDDSFAEAAQSWLANNPREVIIVTEESVRTALERLAREVDGPYVDPEVRDGSTVGPGSSPHGTHEFSDPTRMTQMDDEPGSGPQKRGRIRVLTVPQANKRLQMAAGIRATRTDLIVFADDDALWPPTLLPQVLACFEDPSVGGVGTSQIVHPCAPGGKFTWWETLAAIRLSIRNIEIACSTHIDGGVPCLSGRTSAYRTPILQEPSFLHGFTHDYWRGKYHLNSGDDKFLTRWMVSHGWSTYVQCCAEAEIQSTMRPDWRFLKQVLRWTRNTWRSDLRSLFVERHIWRRHPYVAYTMLDKCLKWVPASCPSSLWF